ncbi:MAG: isocitrate/isopropylmalate dehydrogenase family protein [Oscillospiraceae bacterium]|nr:isocitrate/isopropylmalate dehydrogenase family protein [Oscillospiraceae bacterium]
MNYIDSAVAEFRKILLEQQERCHSMDGENTDFSALKALIIGLIDGDGIGPTIMAEAKRVLRELLKDEISAGTVVLKEIEGLTLENRLSLGESVPKDVLKEIRSCHVLLKGPTTTPKGGSMESANVTLRRELDLYANVRPVTVPEEGIDWIFFRENTEGEYVLGSRGVELPAELTMDFRVTTVEGTRRIARAAFDYAKNNGKTNVAIVTKANILKKTDGMFSQICHEVAEEYPEITAEDWYIDIMAANLVNKDLRSKFEVFLLPNLYGDILTDEAAQIQGGVGTAGSANIGAKCAMFEAIHGSAPRLIEEGLGDYANPSSILRAVELLLRHVARSSAADRLQKAMDTAAEEKKVLCTGDKNGATCHEFGEYVLSLL